jgi:hypothetical protein
MIEIEIPKIKRTKLYLFGEKENKEREKERKKNTCWGQTTTPTRTRASPKERGRDGASNDIMKARV